MVPTPASTPTHSESMMKDKQGSTDSKNLPQSPTDHHPTWIRKTFQIAGLVNIVGILLVSHAFTDSLISDLDPDVFSTPSLILIMVWGCAYLSVGPYWQKIPTISLVFAIEKLVYVVMWFRWISERHNELPAIWNQNPPIALFFGGYGVVDLAFGLFFLWAWRKARSHPL